MSQRSRAHRKAPFWTYVLLVLLATQLWTADAGSHLKIKKFLKKALLLRALLGKKGLTIVPIPIPLDLFMKEGKGEAPKMQEPPMHHHAPPMPFPYFPLPDNGASAKMHHFGNHMMPPPPTSAMMMMPPPHGNAMMMPSPQGNAVMMPPPQGNAMMMAGGNGFNMMMGGD